MNLLFVADPLESFKPYKDTTFAMMREAAARGHGLWACEPAHLNWQRGAPVCATVRQLRLTGTLDDSPIGDLTPESRLRVYPGLPPGGKYELVLDGAEHSAFGERASPLDKTKPNPNHHRAILAISTAFWDAYLREDAAAKIWLDGDGPRGVLEKADAWRHK